jgi:hypothetical protein
MRNHLISWLKMKGLLSIITIYMLQLPVSAQLIPYPEALNKAAIVQTSIEHIDSAAMIIGNGDINALIYSENNNIVMHLAKNDVWDARLVTEKDPPLLNVNVEKHTWTGGSRPPSWNHPYPTQTPPAIIRIQLIPQYPLINLAKYSSPQTFLNMAYT